MQQSTNILLRDSIKWKHYNRERVIMWDNTDVPFKFKPSASDNQRKSYSAYYAGNVAKGGVFIQPCGWMGTHELWEGSVSDSHYLEKSGILLMQQTYLLKTDEKTSDTTWMIILDKEYRVTETAWNEGQQLVLQPSFSRSDQKFTAHETLLIAAITTDRSANERAVKLSKASAFVSSGLHPNENPQRLADVWLAWGFMCNFRYRPVV
jgi:DDE superfamily endonuclease